MKQNNGVDYTYYVCIFFFTLAFAWLEWPEVIAGLQNDPVCILQEIDKPKALWPQTSDWHELLFIYEGRVLLHVLNSCVPNLDCFLSDCVSNLNVNSLFSQHLIDKFAKSNITYRMIFLIYIMWGCVTLMLYTMLCLLFKSLKCKKITFVIFILNFLLSFVFIRHYHYALFYKYLDGFFFSFVISGLIGVRLCYLSKGYKRFFWLLFVLICLFHCLGYRRVALISMPVVFYALVYIFFNKRNFLFKVFLSLSCALFFSLGFNFLISLLPSSHKHSAVIMLYSDMSIAAQLSGDWKTFQEISQNVGINTLSDVKDHTSVPLAQRYSGVKLPPPDSKEQWYRFLDEYIGFACRHPKEIVLGKIISLTQFYSNFHVPEFEQNFISAMCPKFRSSEKSWSARPVSIHDSGGRYEKIYLYSISAVLLISLLLKWQHVDHELRFFTFVSLVGMVYSLSYWPITPTPDARYHSFPVFAQCMFLSYVVARVISHIYFKLIKKVPKQL